MLNMNSVGFVFLSFHVIAISTKANIIMQYGREITLY